MPLHTVDYTLGMSAGHALHLADLIDNGYGWTIPTDTLRAALKVIDPDVAEAVVAIREELEARA